MTVCYRVLILPTISTFAALCFDMATKTQQPKGRDDALSSLNTAINVLNRAGGATSVTEARAAFTSAGVLLTMIRVGFIPVRVSRLLANVTIQDSMVNKADYVELGLTCVDVCEVLSRGIDGKRADQLSQSVLKAIAKFTS